MLIQIAFEDLYELVYQMQNGIKILSRIKSGCFVLERAGGITTRLYFQPIRQYQFD